MWFVITTGCQCSKFGSDQISLESVIEVMDVVENPRTMWRVRRQAADSPWSIVPPRGSGFCFLMGIF